MCINVEYTSERTKLIEISKQPILLLTTAEMSSTNGVNSPAIERTSPVLADSATGDTSFHHFYTSSMVMVIN